MNEKPSLWILYIGMLTCFTGVGLPVGIILCFWYFWMDYHYKQNKETEYEMDDLSPEERYNMI